MSHVRERSVGVPRLRHFLAVWPLPGRFLPGGARTSILFSSRIPAGRAPENSAPQSLSILAAQIKSFSLRPPIAWVVNRTRQLE